MLFSQDVTFSQYTQLNDCLLFWILLTHEWEKPLWWLSYFIFITVVVIFITVVVVYELINANIYIYHTPPHPDENNNPSYLFFPAYGIYTVNSPTSSHAFCIVSIIFMSSCTIGMQTNIIFACSRRPEERLLSLCNLCHWLLSYMKSLPAEEVQIFDVGISPRATID